MRNLPSLSFEAKLWSQGFEFVAGADEVGRGSFAGPVVATTVVFAPMINDRWLMVKANKEIKIDDSKKLAPLQRVRASKWIRENSLAWGVGEASVSEINSLGMGKASNKAFRRAVFSANKKIEKRIEFLLIDGFYIPYLRGFMASGKKAKQLAVKKGDEKSFSIASASIIAKVYRDRLMKRLSQKHPEYGWGRNKGYGTKEHQGAILKHGLTRYHRKQFVRTFFNNSYVFQVQSSV